MSKQVIVPKGKYSDPVPVNVNNWPDQFPYSPEVSVSLKHESDAMFLRFKVSENYTKAEITENNGKVWTDSCVEFFISFDNVSYYNLETTCAGVQLLGYRKNGEVTHASSEVISSILKNGTFVGKSFSEITGDIDWDIELRIPVSALFKHEIASFDGMRIKGNFYKCGDDLSHPHFLSWAPVSTEKPNFHVPEFFGEIVFE